MVKVDVLFTKFLTFLSLMLIFQPPLCLGFLRNIHPCFPRQFLYFLYFLGTTLGSKAYAPSSAIGGGGMTLVGGVGAGVGFHHPNKFNTISNIHKRGGGKCQTVCPRQNHQTEIINTIKYFSDVVSKFSIFRRRSLGKEFTVRRLPLSGIRTREPLREEQHPSQ